MRKHANSTRRLLHSPPNGAWFDALLPKCGPDVTVPQPEYQNSAFEGDFYQFLHFYFRNFQPFLPSLWARSRRRQPWRVDIFVLQHGRRQVSMGTL